MSEWNFVVTGLKYNTSKLPVDFEIGTIVELDHQHTHQKDPNAIRIWVNGEKIGYVPNQGEYCGKCLKKVKQGVWNCNHCHASSEEFLIGGIATRIVESGILDKPHMAFINRIDERRILIKLMLLEIEGEECLQNSE